MTDIISLTFELAINIFQCIMFVTFCHSFLGAKYDKKKDLIAYISAVIVMFAVITIQNHFVISFAFSEIILFCAVMLPYTTIFLKGKIYLRIAIPLFAYGICMCVSIGLSLFSSVIFDIKHTNIFSKQSFLYRVVMVLLINIVDIFVYYMIIKIYKGKINLKSYTDILFFIILPVVTIAILFLTYTMATDSSTTDLYRLFLCAISVAMFMVTVLVLNAMAKVTKINEIKMQNIIMKNEQEMYINEIKNGSEYIREIAKIKHDMKNKVFCIGEMLETDNIEEAKMLCNSMAYELKNVSEAFNTPNIHLNSILNVSYKKAKENGIDIFVVVQTILEEIDGIDLITVIGNLCDNAIEALLKQKNQKMQLLLTRRSGYYMVIVKNYIDESVITNNPLLVSDKDNKLLHGHGIKNVREILKKYRGDIKVYEEDCYFTVEAFFEIPSTVKK